MRAARHASVGSLEVRALAATVAAVSAASAWSPRRRAASARPYSAHAP